MTEKVREQIESIRRGGESNMFDTNMVQRLAFDAGFYELVMFIEEHKREYVNFILYGRDEG